MPYLLSIDAENDLREIARYTHQQWSNKQFIKYRDGLKNALTKIGEGQLIAKSFSQQYP